MNTKNKIIGIVALLLVVVGAGIYFYMQQDKKAIADFATAYKNFDKAMDDFSVPVFASNLEGAPALDKFNKIYLQISDSMKNPIPYSDRLDLTKQAMFNNNFILDYLNKTDDQEGKAGEAILGMNTKAATIKNLELRNKAIEIADNAKKEFDNMSQYKRAIWDKRNITNKLLQNIVNDNGGLTGFISFLS